MSPRKIQFSTYKQVMVSITKSISPYSHIQTSSPMLLTHNNKINTTPFSMLLACNCNGALCIHHDHGTYILCAIAVDKTSCFCSCGFLMIITLTGSQHLSMQGHKNGECQVTLSNDALNLTHELQTCKSTSAAKDIARPQPCTWR